MTTKFSWRMEACRLVNLRAFRQPAHKKTILEDMIKEMIRQRIIGTSRSPSFFTDSARLVGGSVLSVEWTNY